MILLHISATCALCSSTSRATREYKIQRSSLVSSVTGRLSIEVVPQWYPCMETFSWRHFHGYCALIIHAQF